MKPGSFCLFCPRVYGGGWNLWERYFTSYGKCPTVTLLSYVFPSSRLMRDSLQTQSLFHRGPVPVGVPGRDVVERHTPSPESRPVSVSLLRVTAHNWQVLTITVRSARGGYTYTSNHGLRPAWGSCWSFTKRKREYLSRYLLFFFMFTHRTHSGGPGSSSRRGHVTCLPSTFLPTKRS